MKKFLTILCLLTLNIIVVTAFAAEKVVVIPLNSAQRTGSPEKLWGQGRPYTTTLLHKNDSLVPGFCTSLTGVEFALSKHMVSWDGADAACPKDTWVCTSEEILDKSCPLNAIPSTFLGISCDGELIPLVSEPNTDLFGWVADANTRGGNTEALMGHLRSAESSVFGSSDTCSTMRVWCCR